MAYINEVHQVNTAILGLVRMTPRAPAGKIQIAALSRRTRAVTETSCGRQCGWHEWQAAAVWQVPDVVVCHLEEAHLQQLRSGGPLRRVLGQTCVYHFLERLQMQQSCPIIAQP